MTSDEPTRMMQIAMNEDEAVFFNSHYSLGVYVMQGDLVGAFKAKLVCGISARTLGQDRVREFSERLDTLLKRAFPRLAVVYNPNEKPHCTHCSCDDRTCCWCGEYKDL